MVNAAAPEVVTQIYPETVSQRSLPVNFDADHRALFEPDFERTIPATQLIKLEKVRISREGIFFRGNDILPQSFAFPWHLEEWRARSILKFLVTNHLFRRRRRIEDEIVWITDYWSTGYFHWLTDALTRLLVMRDRLDDQALMLPSGYENRDVVMSSLKAFGVSNVNFIKPNEALDCRSVLMSTHTAPPGHFRDEAIHGVREVLLAAFGDRDYQGTGERIYITRKRAAKRRIANEDELRPILGNFGFETIYAEDLSFEQQVKACSRARYIVSNHGAGLTNAMFMQAGGRLLELRHLWDRNRNCFFVMSSALRLNYFYQRCRPQEYEAHPHTADLIVDVEEFQKTLSLFATNFTNDPNQD